MAPVGTPSRMVTWPATTVAAKPDRSLLQAEAAGGEVVHQLRHGRADDVAGRTR